MLAKNDNLGDEIDLGPVPFHYYTFIGVIKTGSSVQLIIQPPALQYKGNG